MEGGGLKEVVPKLPEGGKIHYPIFHDETCCHANDQVQSAWVRNDEQPLRDKSRGRIVHVSDFIVEHSGRLVLNEAERQAQDLLPERPNPPSSAASTPTRSELVDTTQTGKNKKKKKGDAPQPATVRSFMELENEWVPPPPPAPFTSYRLKTYDARKIIHPGSNGDAWWDMPQLIAQVRCLAFMLYVFLLTRCKPDSQCY
jgi:hypothetical protein